MVAVGVSWLFVVGFAYWSLSGYLEPMVKWSDQRRELCERAGIDCGRKPAAEIAQALAEKAQRDPVLWERLQSLSRQLENQVFWRMPYIADGFTRGLVCVTTLRNDRQAIEDSVLVGRLRPFVPGCVEALVPTLLGIVVSVGAKRREKVVQSAARP